MVIAPLLGGDDGGDFCLVFFDNANVVSTTPQPPCRRARAAF